jgi:hypothetical protein
LATIGHGLRLNRIWVAISTGDGANSPVTPHQSNDQPDPGYVICYHSDRRDLVMSLVRLLGFKNLPCGCVVGRYRDLASERELTYVEEKGSACDLHGHRRNHTVTSLAASPRYHQVTEAARAS